MKRYFILFFACLVVFGSIYPIYSEEKTLHQTWLDAEKALGDAQKRLKPLEIELAGYETEHAKIVGSVRCV